MGRKSVPMFFEEKLDGLTVKNIWTTGDLQQIDKNRILQEIVEHYVNLPIDSHFSRRSFTLYPMPSDYAIKVPETRIRETTELLKKRRLIDQSDDNITFHGRQTGRPPIQEDFNTRKRVNSRLRAVREVS